MARLSRSNDIFATLSSVLGPESDHGTHVKTLVPTGMIAAVHNVQFAFIRYELGRYRCWRRRWRGRHPELETARGEGGLSGRRSPPSRPCARGRDRPRSGPGARPRLRRPAKADSAYSMFTSARRVLEMRAMSLRCSARELFGGEVGPCVSDARPGGGPDVPRAAGARPCLLRPFQSPASDRQVQRDFARTFSARFLGWGSRGNTGVHPFPPKMLTAGDFSDRHCRSRQNTGPGSSTGRATD